MINLSKNNQTLLFIAIAFIFSISVRLIWVYQFNDVEQFKYNEQFMINTNDGYAWAEGARDILAGFHQENDRSNVEWACSKFTAFLVKILPFSFETIIFYMPAFFSSLVVIPIILIGRSLGNLEMGFIASLLAGIAWSYYNRTMVGYYDTDFLNIVFPMFLLWSLIWAINTKENKFLYFIALEIIAYRWWYPSSYSLEFAFFGLIFIYFVYLYLKNKDYNYILILLTFIIVSMVYLDAYIRLIMVTVLFILYQKKLLEKYLFYIFSFSLILFFLTGGFDPIWLKIKGYMFKDNIMVIDENVKLHFYGVLQTIREAAAIPFETFANRISGHLITFILSCIGYLWLIFRYPIMILGLPMIGLGFLAYSGGLRFTIYAVPILAFGISFLIVQLSNFIKNKLASYILKISLVVLILLPNITHIINYRVPTVLKKDEVIVLSKLKGLVDRNDYVIGWWDYGYPIRYYSDVKTITDGGRQRSSINFPTSFALSHPQEQASKMLRLDVEYTNLIASDTTNKYKTDITILEMMEHYGYKDSNKFLESLKSDMDLPEKTCDVYLYLPNRMMDILPTVTLFSNIDLMTGERRPNSFFYRSRNYKENGNFIELGRGIRIIKNKGQVQIGKKIFPINDFAVTQYDNRGKLRKQVQTINKNALISVIFMKNYNTFLVVDKKMYNSSYIQMFALENYDKNLFEPVILSPLSKIYKLKI